MARRLAAIPTAAVLSLLVFGSHCGVVDFDLSGQAGKSGAAGNSGTAGNSGASGTLGVGGGFGLGGAAALGGRNSSRGGSSTLPEGGSAGRNQGGTISFPSEGGRVFASGGATPSAGAKGELCPICPLGNCITCTPMNGGATGMNPMGGAGGTTAPNRGGASNGGAPGRGGNASANGGANAGTNGGGTAFASGGSAGGNLGNASSGGSSSGGASASGGFANAGRSGGAGAANAVIPGGCPDNLVCDARCSVCVQCMKNNDCALNENCDPVTRLCLPACMMDKDCNNSTYPVCINRGRYVCLQCNNNLDCFGVFEGTHCNEYGFCVH